LQDAQVKAQEEGLEARNESLHAYWTTLEAKARANEVWIDPATTLMWTKTDNGNEVNSNEARDYCLNLKLAGHNDWRLPTINELEGIYENKEDTYEHNVKGGLQLSAWMVWSGSKGGAYGEEWLFFFIEGKRSFVSIKDTSALCVRRPGE
jgi:hypothetical protein